MHPRQRVLTGVGALVMVASVVVQMFAGKIGGQLSLGLVGGGNGWSEADESGRAAIWEAHKQYTLKFYHFLTTDPAVLEGTRKRYAKLGLCKDEFPTTGTFRPRSTFA